MAPLTSVVGRPGQPEAFYGVHKGQKRENSVDNAIMCGPGLARSIRDQQEQRQIARRRLDEQFLVNIPEAPNIQPAHPAGVELMSEVAFDSLAPCALQLPASFATDAPAVGVHRVLLAALPFQLRGPRSGSAM